MGVTYGLNEDTVVPKEAQARAGSAQNSKRIIDRHSPASFLLDHLYYIRRLLKGVSSVYI